jgi:hypothetical protein
MDSFGGDRSDPLSLHKYLYAETNPADRIDPSGNFSIYAQAVTIAILVIAAAITTVSVRNTLLNRSQSSDELLIHVDDQPIVVDGSGWDDATVQANLDRAADFWFAEAGIHVTTRRIKHIQHPELLDSSKFVNNPQKYFTILEKQLDDPFTKHVTVFTKDTPGSLGFSVGPFEADRLPFNTQISGISFISTFSLRGYVTAHEWGHTFGLRDGGVDEPGNIMFYSPFPILSFPGLTRGQRELARQTAVRY